MIIFSIYKKKVDNYHGNDDSDDDNEVKLSHSLFYTST
jgi:hypothetical protein